MLDLDETLIHSHHDGVLRPTVRPGTPPDFILKVCGGGSEAMVIPVIVSSFGLPSPIIEHLFLKIWHQCEPEG